MTSTVTQTPVLICGSGPTGLTAALVLSRAGVSCRIVDRRTAASGLSRATGLNARSLELLDQLGVADRLLAAGFPLTKNSYLDGREVIGCDDLGVIDSDMPSLLAISEATIEDHMTSHLSDFGIPVERGVEVIGMDPHGKGPVTVRHADGRLADIDARWVVDAEGAHSTLRERLDIHLIGEPVPGGWVAADVITDSWPFDAADTPNWLDADVFWAQPLPGGAIRVFFRHDADELTVRDVQAQVDARFPEPTTVLGVAQAGHFRLRHCVVESLARGSVFLAGDAAHQCSPVGGRGMNLGIQDAANIGWKLAVAGESTRSGVVLASYDAERRPVDADAIGAVARSFARLADPEVDPDHRWSPASPADSVRHNDTSRDISTRYLDSPIIDYRDHRTDPAVPVGMRVPNAALSVARDDDPSDLRSLLAVGGHVVLEIPDPRGVPAVAVDAAAGGSTAHPPAGGRLTVQDPDAELARILTPGTYAIRPDGVLACAAPPGAYDRITDYFAVLGLESP